MTDCTISGNSASGSGGGVLNYFSTTVMSDCTVSGNSASGNGGGLYDFVGTTTLNDGNFSGNYAENGGGIFRLFRHENAGQLHFQRQHGRGKRRRALQ